MKWNEMKTIPVAILFISLTLTFATADPNINQCIHDTQSMIDSRARDLRIISSGGALGDLGDYTLCNFLSHNDSNYCHFKNATTELFYESIGICLPGSCRGKLFLNDTNFLRNMTAILSSRCPGLVDLVASSVVSIRCADQTRRMLFRTEIALHPGVIAGLAIMIAFSTLVCALSAFHVFTKWRTRSEYDEEIAQQSQALIADPSDTNNNKSINFDEKKERERDKTLFDLFDFNALTLNASFESLKHGGRIKVLDGLRSLAICHVVLGHTFFYAQAYLRNPYFVPAFAKNAIAQFVISSDFGPDVFFFIAGLLIVASLVPRIQKLFDSRGGSSGSFVLKVILFPVKALFHRMLRLWPVYASAVIIYGLALILSMNGGPIAYILTSEQDNCANNYWKSLLFISNLGPWGDMCAHWSWYLDVDVQIFLFSTILLMFIVLITQENSEFKKAAKGVVVIGLVCVGCYASIAYIAIKYEISPNVLSSSMGNPHEKDLYKLPWNRAPPYLIGMAIGWLLKLHEHRGVGNAAGGDFGEDDDISISRTSRLNTVSLPLRMRIGKYIRQVIGLGIIAAAVFGPVQDYQLADKGKGETVWTPTQNTLYLVFGRSAFVFGIALLLNFEKTKTRTKSKTKPRKPDGDGIDMDIISRFLSSSFFIFSSKLTFGVYMLHPIIIKISYAMTKTLFAYDLWTCFFPFVGFLCLSFVAAFVLYCFIEHPASKMFRKMGL